MASFIKSLQLVHTVDADNPVLNDLRLVNGNIAFFEGANAIAQYIKTQLWFWQGEWYLDQLEGFPYYSKVLIKNPSLENIKELYRKVIIDAPGIARVDRLELEINSATRTLNVTFSATTNDGERINNYQFVVGK